MLTADAAAEHIDELIELFHVEAVSAQPAWRPVVADHLLKRLGRLHGFVHLSPHVPRMLDNAATVAQGKRQPYNALLQHLPVEALSPFASTLIELHCFSIHVDDVYDEYWPTMLPKMYAKLGEKLSESADGDKSDRVAPKRKAANSPGQAGKASKTVGE